VRCKRLSVACRLSTQPMPDARYKSCRECGRTVAEVGPLSWSRLCPDCSIRRLDENAIAMLTMQGPQVLHWRRRMAASVGAVLVDEPRSAS
jgi:hypothetical protein